MDWIGRNSERVVIYQVEDQIRKVYSLQNKRVFYLLSLGRVVMFYAEYLRTDYLIHPPEKSLSVFLSHIGG